ncbi:hypothetical protein M9194_16285 [Vibrio sp. S4M6]|uniref:hypothetical protein n=1 Tax=Vibrio sinus TaxID=2946865 RepID=UPI002029FB28|nr:hypothetical protein [Vibrio sinus]MCL9782988.1 hypothetical protein [Vibrio sinus]
MLTRYTGMTAKNQSYLFTFGFVLTVLGMGLTDLWLPMVVGAILMSALMAESWIRVAHIIPMHKELRNLKQQVDQLKQQSHSQEE